MARKTDVLQLVRRLRKEGFLVEATGTGHWAVYSPDGERIATFAQTPSDARWKQNAEAPIKRWKRLHGILTRT